MKLRDLKKFYELRRPKGLIKTQSHISEINTVLYSISNSLQNNILKYNFSYNGNRPLLA